MPPQRRHLGRPNAAFEAALGEPQVPPRIPNPELVVGCYVQVLFENPANERCKCKVTAISDDTFAVRYSGAIYNIDLANIDSWRVCSREAPAKTGLTSSEIQAIASY